MSGYRDLLRAAARATRPRPEQLRRVRARVLSRLPDAVVTRTLGRLLRGPPPGAADRVRSRVLLAQPRSRALPVGAGLLLVAAAVLAWFLFPEPAAPESFVATLEATAGVGRAAPIPGVDLEFGGVGEVAVHGRAVKIAWDVGSLRVEVAPDEGIGLEVTTREAAVRVVGTGFVVNRSALGTVVDVTHGIVEVGCTGAASHRLSAGESTSCLPTSAAGLLGRAQALSDAGAAPEAVLDALDRSLAAAGPDGAVRMEVEATRVFVLIELGRDAEALAQAEAYLARPGAPREADVRQIASNLRSRVP